MSGAYRDSSTSKRYDIIFFIFLWMGKNLYQEKKRG